MKDASLVRQDTFRAVAAAVVAQAGDTSVIQSINKREPLLAAYIAEKMLVVSGKVALSGAPSEMVEGCYEEVANLVTTSVRPVWAGSDELCKGTNLADVGRPPRRRARGSARTAAAPPAQSGETGRAA